MNTDARELSDSDIYERQALADEFDQRYGMKIENHNGNGSFTALKNMVFVAVILSMGAIVWQQQSVNADFREQIAILKLECRNLAQARTYDGR